MMPRKIYEDFVKEYNGSSGVCRQGCQALKASRDGGAAIFLWEKTFPLDETAGKVKKAGGRYRTISHQFSIGALLIERDFPEDIGYFKVTGDKTLGVEEVKLCEQCMNRSRPIILSYSAFAPQYPVMQDYLRRNTECFSAGVNR